MPIPAEHRALIDDILRFWFVPEPGEEAENGFRKGWFVKDPAFDKTVRRRFEPLMRLAAGGELAAWSEKADGALALVLLLDQFPRNVYRGKPRMFATDAKALAVAEAAIDAGHDAALPPPRRLFLYLPLEHAEDLARQARCCELVRALEADLPEASGELLRYAERHREVIERFGRFPHRNAVLRRKSTPEELAFLEQPDSGF